MPQTHRPVVVPPRKKKPPNWKIFDFPEKQQKLIHHQWGQHYQRQAQYEAAISNFRKSKGIQDENREYSDTIHDLGRSHLAITEVKEAGNVVNGRAGKMRFIEIFLK